MFCNNCGSPNAEQAQFCEKCGFAISQNAMSASAAGGVAQPQQGFYQNQMPPQTPYQGRAPYMDPRIRGAAADMANAQYAVGKSPILALVLSFLIPGVGQFYNGDTKRGLPMFLVGIFAYLLVLLPILGWAIAIGVHIWSMVNAYSVADQKTPLG